MQSSNDIWYFLDSSRRDWFSTWCYYFWLTELAQYSSVKCFAAKEKISQFRQLSIRIAILMFKRRRNECKSSSMAYSLAARY